MEAPAEFVRAVRRAYRPERFVLIGSRARGNPLRESDWDFVLVSEAFRGQPAPDRVRGVRTCWPLEDDLDLLCLSPEEWRGEEARGISWIVTAARQGQDVLGPGVGDRGEERPMREETRQWWALAEADQAAAEKLVGEGHFHIAVFLAHQAAEKALKALWIEREREDPPKTHELESMARRLSAPEAVLRAARNLSPEFVVTRYPSPSLGSPLDRYSADAARDRLAEARAVLEWVKAGMPPGL